MPVLRRTVIALAILPLAPAWAADATPAGATALEQNIREWLTGLLGPAIPVMARPVQITPGGDHYDVRIPFAPERQATPDTAALTATARMLDGGKWNIDSIKLPSPAQFTIQLPSPPKEGETTPGPLAPVTYNLTLGQQSNQILYDPTFATASTLTSSLQDFDLKADGLGIAQTSHADRSNTVTTMRPAGTDRVDVSTDSTLENYTIDQKTGDLEPFKMTMQRAHITAAVTSASRSRATELIQGSIQMVATAMAGPPKDGTPAAAAMDPKMIKLLLTAMMDFASGFTIDETLEKLSIAYGDFGGTLDQARLGMGAKSVNGILQAQMDIGMQGLALPDLPLGDMAVLIPSRIALRPVVSGLATADLARLINDAKPDQDPSQADLAALFSHGGITTGLESFAVDVAGSSFAGMGKLVFASPQAFTGTAQITATNFDGLQQQLAAMPALAQQAVPVMIFAKGIGRTVNNQLVWDISYVNNKLLVNNQDLTAMAGGQPSPPPPPQRATPRPQQPTRKP